MIQLSNLATLLRSVRLDEPADVQQDDSANAAHDEAQPTPDTTAGMAALRVLVETPPPAPADEGAQQRADEARRLKEDGLASPAPQPPPTKEELDALAARIAAADDDASVGIASDPRAMAIATPQQKAALLRELMDGHTNGDEEAAIKQILLSCTSRAEMDQVVQMAGGIQAIADELEAGDLQAVIDHANALTTKQEAAAEQAVSLLERAQSDVEFEQLYQALGGDSLKYALPQPRPGSRRTPQQAIELLGRMEALGRKHGVAGVGFGLPPEKTAALQAAIQKAIADGDNAAIARLADDSDAMRVASPAQKAQMVRILQDGWTKDSQDMAIARILTSCGAKAEFDQVVDMAGGRAILDDLDLDEAKADINKLMGGFDRLDCADDPATAGAYRGVLLPPMVDELASTRAPTDAELREVLGPDAFPQGDERDPAVAAARQRLEDVRTKMGKAAHDLQADPMARNKLALINRQRALEGQPPLDYTSLVTQAYRAANDPAVEAAVSKAVAEAESSLGPLDAAKKQEIREQVLEHQLGAIAQQYGLSEQAMKTLVTAKMGRVLQEGAREVATAATGSVTALRARLADVERTEGPDSREANSLRESIRRLARDAQGWLARLQANGAAAGNLFKVPPSFAEDFVQAMSVVGDVLAAVVNVIPGVGQAVSGAYFGVKAIIAAANGDVLGAFKGLLSAVPGVSGVFGAAGAAINTGAKMAQAGIAAGESIANGDPLALLGAAGSVAGDLGLDARSLVPGGDAVRDLVAQVVPGDVASALGEVAGLAGATEELGGVAKRLQDGIDLARRGLNPLEQLKDALLPDLLRSTGAGALADAIERLGSSGPAQGVRQMVGFVARFADAAGRGDAGVLGNVLRDWIPDLAAGNASRSIARLADEARQVLRSPVWLDARKNAQAVAQAEQALRRIAQLGASAEALRRFEQQARGFGARVQGDWAAAGAAMLRQLELR